jgi:D-3-phosphoglycerate dehydrogenase
MKRGEWRRRSSRTEITGKTLGILGVGNIGSVVPQGPWGSDERPAYDPFISAEAADKLGVTLVSMDDLFKKSDFISIHVPLTAETKGIVNAGAFKKMKKGVKIINGAWGGIVNEFDLAEAIKAKIVSGAACDVFEKEPPLADNPLVGLEDVILTPHLGPRPSKRRRTSPSP